ncbi:MAG: YihY/virulence factor BrkB family protein [Salinivirgaceae bacterium]|nr:YihY/virulence factor BrkB family protein [Salinivirgaceae bacterium]MDD4747351.1 YihY/virulence factor BrkB family protein [Salinivirgaceae bacterium]MDY0281913.1 YihY/virulence factor BrkB family protein [Salinivirgaceae bacterium]
MKLKDIIPTIIRFGEKQLAILEKVTGKIHPIGFSGMSLWDVGLQFFTGITQGAIGMRGSAIAFNFFLAMFPAIMFVFTLIPYLPIEDFQNQLIQFIGTLVPETSFDIIETTIRDIITRKRGSLLSFGFIAALYFSTNGFVAIISAFNETVNYFEKRSWIAIRVTSILLIFIILIFVSITIGLITFGETILNYLVLKEILVVGITYYLLIIGKWIITISFFYFSIAMVYYLAPAKRKEFRFFSPGATLATILGIIIIIGFSFYINNFNRYNTLYGSIGTLIIILLWFQLNATILLIGFELNTSIFSLRKASEPQKAIN